MQTFLTVLLVLIGVFLFGFIIFFHEFGHFLMAKLSGVRVLEFSIGMGPRLFSFTRKETKYALRLLPIGGYCAMEGEDEKSDDPRAFGNKPVWRRILVVVAGGLFNILLGLIFMFFSLLPTKVFGTADIAAFADGSQLAAAGAQVADTIVEIDGERVYTDKDVILLLGLADPEHVSMKVRREGKVIDLGTFALASEEEQGRAFTKLDFQVKGLKSTPLLLLKHTFLDSYNMMRSVFLSLKGLITGRFGFRDLAGPVGTIQTIAKGAASGVEHGFLEGLDFVFYIIILLTFNLGIMNLLPLPALDGGRLLFLIWEGVTRKPVPPKYEGYVHAAGFVILMVFMLAVTFSDVWRILEETLFKKT